jgi:membrane protein required for colicin V production
MASFTLVDGVVLAIIILSAVLAYARGLAREAMSIAGWIIAGVVGFYFAPTLEPLVREIPVVRDVLGSNCELGLLAGFAVGFAAALIVVSLFTPLIAGAVANSALGPIDQGLGFLFGIIRGVLLVVIALVVYGRIFGEAGGIPQVDNSHSAAVLAGLEDRIAAALPENAPQWFEARYTDLTRNCPRP